MKRAPLFMQALTILVITGSLAACKKQTVSQKANCRVSKAVIGGLGEFSYYYNADGKISSIESPGPSGPGLVETFSYNSNIITRLDNYAGTFRTRLIITLNANGQATNVRKNFNEAGTNWQNIANEYNGTELIKATYTNAFNSDSTIYAYTWDNGNIESITGPGGFSALEYFTDKPAQDGDYLISLTKVYEGYETFKYKNIVKSISGTNGVEVNYSYDASGKIISLNYSTGTQLFVTTYQYQCN
jgi:hypothetical protein